MRTPVSQLAMRKPDLKAFEDLRHAASDSRIQRVDDLDEVSEEAVAMATVVRAFDGGPLRTFSGGRSHENGWHISFKAGRMLHWEGETALFKLIECEGRPDVARINTESVGFEFVLNGMLVTYTIDIELVAPNGRVTLLEVKRTEHDLDEPDYRLRLAYVREVCRRCGIGFEVVFRADIFRSGIHRRNAALVASRGFVPFSDRHRSVLTAHRRTRRGETTYGSLAADLEPGHPVAGKAVVQAMIVSRLVDMDLTARLKDDSPVLIG